MKGHFLELARMRDKLAYTPDKEGWREGEMAFGIADAPFISGWVYPKTQAAYDAVKEKAMGAGGVYADTTVGKGEDAPKDYIFLSLTDEEMHKAECRSCNAVISRRGVAAHNHKCEACGKPTALTYTRDGAIRLTFMDRGRYIGNDVMFRIFEYREHVDRPHELVVYAAPILKEYESPDGRVYARRSLFGVSSEDEAQVLLEDTKHLYRRETVKVIDGDATDVISVLAIPNHDPHFVTEKSVFNTSEIWGEVRNYNSVKFWEGKKYGDFDRLPIPESLHLSSKYVDGHRHSLAEPDIVSTIMSAAGQVSRADYYHQDGRPAFSGLAYDRMTQFVTHFVDVPVKKWNTFLRGAPEDGPGFIYAFAAWTGKLSGTTKTVKDGPNFGNALTAMVRLSAGEPLSLQEAVAYEEGLQTPQAQIMEEGVERILTNKLNAAIRKSGRRKKGPQP